MGNVKAKTQKPTNHDALNRRALTAAEIKRAEQLDAIMRKYGLTPDIVGRVINRSRYTVHSYRTKRRAMPVAALRELRRVASYIHATR